MHWSKDRGCQSGSKNKIQLYVVHKEIHLNRKYHKLQADGGRKICFANTKIILIIFFAAKDGEALYSQQKQDREPTVAQIMNTFLPNSDLN